jgi:hypothetical protein
MAQWRHMKKLVFVKKQLQIIVLLMLKGNFKQIPLEMLNLNLT